MGHLESCAFHVKRRIWRCQSGVGDTSPNGWVWNAGYHCIYIYYIYYIMYILYCTYCIIIYLQYIYIYIITIVIIYHIVPPKQPSSWGKFVQLICLRSSRTSKGKMMMTCVDVASFKTLPSGYLTVCHGIDGPFIDGLPIKMVMTNSLPWYRRPIYRWFTY